MAAEDHAVMEPSRSPESVIHGRRFASRRLRLALAVAATLLVGLAVFDPIWLRPLVQHYIRQHADRQIDFDRLQFGLDAALQPVVRLRDLTISNAPWAAARPLIKASRVEWTIAWRSFRGNGVIIPRLVIVDGDIDLERQVDGLRNWRLSDPLDRGPGRVRILSLQASSSRMRIVNLGQDLTLDLSTAPLAAPRALATRPELMVSQRLHLDGRHRSTRFDGDIDIGEVLTLFDTGIPFALSGYLQSGAAKIEAEGVAHDLMQLAGFDLKWHFASADLAQSAAFIGGRSLPPLAADATGRMRKDGGHWAASDVRARVGGSDLSGNLNFEQRSDGSRARLGGELAGERLSLDDFRAAAGLRKSSVEALAVKGNVEAVRRLDDVDAELELKMAKVDGRVLGRFGPVGNVHTHLSLQAGRLVLAPVGFALAGGAGSGRVTVDATREPAETALDLQFNRLRLDRLINQRSSLVGIEGGLNLRLALRSQGDSLAALRDGIAGDASADLFQATLPATLDARLALDAGHWLRAAFSPGRRVGITCSAAAMHFQGGRGRTTRLAIETDSVLLSGNAAVDLKQQTFDLLLTPHRKQQALLALDKSVRVSGGFRQPKVALTGREQASAAAECSGAARQPAGSSQPGNEKGSGEASRR